MILSDLYTKLHTIKNEKTMSCILRIEGANFKVHEFLKQTNLKPYIAYLKGDELGFTRRGTNTY